MKSTTIAHTVLLALSLAGGLASAAPVPIPSEDPHVTASLFQLSEVSSHGLIAAGDTDSKCGAGACGSAKPSEKKAHHQCGTAGKHPKHKSADGKCAASQCASQKSDDSKCAASQCASVKASPNQ